MISSRALRLRGPRRLLHPWQVELEDGSVPGLAVDRDVSAALLGDAVHRGQPEPGALAHLLGGEEGLEDVRLDLGGHAVAGIADREHDVGARLDLGMGPGVGLVQGHVAGRERQPAPVRHRVAGVDGQVEQDLLDLPRVGLDAPGGRIERGRDLDVLADHATQQGLDSGHDGVQIQHARLQDLLAAEGQELMRELGGALGGALDDLDLPPDRVLRGQRVEHEIAAAADGGQQVVEVVGHAGREPPDALHLLGLTELIFQVAALRDVAGHAQSGDRVAVLQDAGHVHLEQDARAILLG